MRPIFCWSDTQCSPETAMLRPPACGKIDTAIRLERDGFGVLVLHGLMRKRARLQGTRGRAQDIRGPRQPRLGDTWTWAQDVEPNKMNGDNNE
jgi:hypothetical protein